ncbi:MULTISPECIES: hypothetical protein [unclassified Paenibacillus]|uniref:hypothetical protein n=1 Tax=unclassified Paenibacillus TaxID=185978 RepID=UPI0024052864|nr:MULTISPECIES: hypothetical protein [unclassified Paenibacillus]MDF9844584.1 hypothetical protein [Paenibacillus sp. PastF-2]MDF9851238.1 hypothetical protein [Paenibacillus sp. PastM-2]MDF9857769.1 hypothetical protein [Paenibacillus sp. PastF-1]MDH6483087.1 hypothetical protein [Paenibacillus sp. PastH-2]MDH6510449.1 hypothetical protein [Paenibacillus sp. PastM-3]
MLATSKSSDPVFDALAHKLSLMLYRWRIKNGRLIVAYPDAAIWWLDREIAEMEAGK